MTHLKIATTCSVQLLDLINGILDFSRLTSNTLTLVSEPFSIEECINNSITVIQTRASTKGLKLNVNRDSNIPVLVIGDKKRLTQVLVNLLSNAIKFTDKGTIDLKVFARKYSEDNDLLWKITFEVTDTGIGIQPCDQEKVFSAFSQLKDQTAYNKQDGAGLGLAISKELVELMGGQMKMYSVGYGKGSTFTFYINVEENIDIHSMLSKHAKSINNISILNVDDKMENLLILDEILFRWNINSIMCNSAEQALRYLGRGKKFDLAIIDICMPYMSGIELAQRLRELYPSLPLIGISSIGNDAQGEEWFDSYMSKPYNQSKILKAIINCLEKDSSLKVPNRRKKTKDKKTLKTLKILLAEDDDNAQYMMREMIYSLGFSELNLTIVSNGKEAVEAVKKDSYDVCLMDIKMPIMDGIEASRHIRAIPDHPSIIAVSAGVMDSDKNNYLQAGMDGYLAKPFSTKELDTVLKRYIA